jgi:omega-amidase
MRAHLVQLDIVWEDREANFAKVERLMDRANPDAGDLVVLPEMFDTGFSMNTAKTADREGLTLKFLQRLAQDLGVFVQGGRTVLPCHCARASNVATIVSPTGEPIAEYAKIRLFPLGTEPQAIEGGARVGKWAWESSGTRLAVCPLICYDLRFPELFREGLRLGAELYAIGACWLQGRHQHWRPLLQARAIENQACVLGVNRTGSDPNSRYLGGTVAFGPKGEVLGELDEAEGVLSVTIDAASVHEWRAKFPAWQQAWTSGGAQPAV